MKVNESNVTVMFSDIDRSVSFYKKIGFTLQNRWENHYAMLATTGITIGLHPASADLIKSSGSVSIGLIVDDAAEAKALLDSNQVAYQVEDGKSGTYLHFKDPDGTILYFTVAKWSR